MHSATAEQVRAGVSTRTAVTPTESLTGTGDDKVGKPLRAGVSIIAGNPPHRRETGSKYASPSIASTGTNRQTRHDNRRRRKEDHCGRGPTYRHRIAFGRLPRRRDPQEKLCIAHANRPSRGRICEQRCWFHRLVVRSAAVRRRSRDPPTHASAAPLAVSTAVTRYRWTVTCTVDARRRRSEHVCPRSSGDRASVS